MKKTYKVPEQLKRGDKVTYTVTDPWGKSWKETSTVVMIYNGVALLESGHRISAWAY